MNLQGKTVLITGATDGLGKEVALLAAKAGATVLLHGRNRVKAEPVLEAVQRAGSAEFGDKPRAENAQGVELHFQVNYLAPFLLTRLLLPQIKAAAPSRIVNVASIGQAPVDFDDVQFTRGYSGMDAYRRSKLAQIMFTIDLAEALKGSGVTVMSLHPGTLMNTNMVVGQGMTPQSKVEDGAEATFRLAFSPEHEGETGGYYDQFNPAQPNPQAADAEARRRLWDLSEALTA